jgi:UPF0755 protein
MLRVLTALLLMAVLIAGWGWLELEQPVQFEGDELAVVLAAGETPGQALRRLDGEGRLQFGPALRIYLRLQDPSRVQVGEYVIGAGSSARDLVAALYSGKAAQRAFTLIEGDNFRQLRAALSTETRLRQELAALDDAAVMAQLGAAGVHPEGRFAPDTYFYAPYASSDLDLLRRAYAEQQARLAAAWASRAPDLPYRSPDELLVMASIVEKETGQAQERPAIAGVFVRRLRIGMRLQTDPTVIYGLGATFNGNLTRAHLRTPTPWNTYTIDGLPPTPIAMPSRAALEAAAHPADGDVLYFVGRGDGSHQFSATLQEHNRAVREYQLRRRDGYHSAPRSAPP